MPRGRLPSGAVAITAWVPASITVRSPDASLVTNTRTAGGGAGAGAGAAAVAGAGLGASCPQPATMIAAAIAAERVHERCPAVMGVMIPQHWSYMSRSDAL